MAKNSGKKGLILRAAAGALVATSTEVLDSLLKATGEKPPAKGESLKDFTARVCTTMASVSDEAFNGLTKEARAWYDKNSALYNEDKFDELEATPGMPGYKAPAGAPSTPAAKTEAPSTAAPSQENADVKKGKKGGKKGGAAPAAKKEESKAKAERQPRTDSTSYQIRLAVVKKPDIEFEKVCEKVGLKGKDASPTSHAHNMFQHARLVMAIALANGYTAK